MGAKTGENWGLLFTDEYTGVICKLFIAGRLFEKRALRVGVLEGEGGWQVGTDRADIVRFRLGTYPTLEREGVESDLGRGFGVGGLGRGRGESAVVSPLRRPDWGGASSVADGPDRRDSPMYSVRQRGVIPCKKELRGWAGCG